MLPSHSLALASVGLAMGFGKSMACRPRILALLMSNAVSNKHQGVAASLISTMVNYSIATGLGIAGTVDRYSTPRDGLLGGFHNAWWLGAASGIAGVLMSLYFVWQTRQPQKC
ncbi:hypothetical protein AC579_5445 [Pseudocercospora musae]|uniref:Major facilitator superfamily (MFS) profile domain-containing protein n=1 Tax=Pseudocercospora musae TaxID=113226 RepID=A0A139HJQ7_9PEZI|nr:hypothetical protein AC579_5445 [Pseudocercospora musae]